MIVLAQQALRSYHARGRMARLAALFTLVGHLVDSRLERECGDGIHWLIRRLGEPETAAVLLAGLLQSVGERAQVDYTREVTFVRVEVEAADLGVLPPHAVVTGRGGRFFLALAPRDARSPLGFLPRAARTGLSRRGRPLLDKGLMGG